MNRPVLLLGAMLMLAALVLPAPVSAQGVDWDIGIVEGQNITLLDDGGLASVEFWIQNDYSVEITVSIGYVIPFNGQATGPEEETIGAEENKTFTVEFSSINVLANRADKTGQFKVNANLDSIAGVPAIFGDARSDDGELVIPRIRGFSIDIENPSGAMNAGTALEVDVKVQNTGNDIDAILDPVFESNICPQLTVEGLEQLEDVAVDAPIDGASGVKTFTLNVVAPQSHPTKVCDLSIAIRSLGEANQGSISAAAEDSIDLEVRKTGSSSGGGSDSSTGGSGSDSGADDGGGDIITRNFTPAAGIWTVFAAAGAAAALIRRNDTE